VRGACGLAIRSGFLSARAMWTPVVSSAVALNNSGMRELLNGIGALGRRRLGRSRPSPQPIRPRKIGRRLCLQGRWPGANIDPHTATGSPSCDCAPGTSPRHEAEEPSVRPADGGANLRCSCLAARDRNLAEEGLALRHHRIPNHGSRRVVDTLTEGAEARVTWPADFAPESSGVVKTAVGPDEKRSICATRLTQLAD